MTQPDGFDVPEMVTCPIRALSSRPHRLSCRHRCLVSTAREFLKLMSPRPLLTVGMRALVERSSSRRCSIPQIDIGRGVAPLPSS